jgi:hypothetical protein
MLELQSVYPETDRFDLNSIDLSPFSVDALDEILTEGSFYIEREDDLFLRIVRLSSEHRPLLSAVGVAALSECVAFPPECIWTGISDLLMIPVLDSAIISDFPKIFDEFRRKKFSLLWRGGRDGFSARDFHNHCDGHANTLTLIKDTNGNIFGGFTPADRPIAEVEREGGEGGRSLQGRSESEEFPFHAEESAQPPGAEVCVEGRKEGEGNQL